MLLLLALAASLVTAGVGRGNVVNLAGWPQLRRFLGAAASPELSTDFLGVVWESTLTTVSYAVLGTAVAVALGLVGGVLVSETWWRERPGVRWRRRAGDGPSVWRPRGVAAWLASRTALALPRGVHEAVWGLFLVSVLGLDPMVGVLAIGLPYGAVTAKVYSELLDEAPHGAFAALRSSGVSRLKAMLYTLGPIASPDMVSYAFYRLECSVRAAAILGVIGAGGLGFQLALSLQSLRYGEMWTLIYALVLVCGLADWWSTGVRRRAGGGGEATIDPASGGAPALGRDRLRNASALAFAGLVVAAALHLRIDASTVWSPRVRELAADIAASSFPPHLGADVLARLGPLALETLAMSVTAIVVASAGAMSLAFVAASNSGAQPARGRGVRRAAPLTVRALLLLCRAVPPPVGALVLLFVFLPGPLPGALALAVYNLGILGRLMAEVVENLEGGPVEALRASGASAAQAFSYAVVPPALPRFVAYALYRWEVTIRETVVVGLVGAGGLGRLLASQLAAFDYRGVVATLLALVALTVVVDVVSARMRRSLR